MKTRFWSIAAIALLVFVAGYRLPQALERATAKPNMYVLQAEAFLGGRLDLQDYTVDAAVHKDVLYAPFPPVPAILLMPQVAVWGRSANPTALAVLLAAGTVLAFAGTMRRLGVRPDQAAWLCAAFVMGTGYWASVLVSWGVWHFAHVSATLFVTLALYESIGRRRGWLVGLLLGGAFMSRQFTLLAAPMLALELLREDGASTSPAAGRRQVIGMAAALGLGVAVYLWFNYARFGSPFDTGYTHIIHTSPFLKERFTNWGLFGPAYLPYNLIQMLLSGFAPTFGGHAALGDFKTSEFGTGLITASPWVLLMFFAGWKNVRARAAVLTCAAIAICQLFYYNNGWIQVNAHRFTLDFLPIAMIPVAIGFRGQAERGQAKLWKWAIGWSVLLNTAAFYLYVPLKHFLDWWPTLF